MEYSRQRFLALSNEETTRQLKECEEGRRKLENDYDELKRVVSAQPKNAIPRKHFIDKMHDYVTMALAGKLGLAEFAEREAQLVVREENVHRAGLELNEAQDAFEQRRQEDETRRRQIEELARRNELSAERLAEPMVAERINALQTTWSEERRWLLGRIDELSAELTQESLRKISALENEHIKKIKNIEQRENLLRVQELKIKGAIDRVNEDLQKNMQVEINSKVLIMEEKHRKALLQHKAQHADFAKTAEVRARATREKIKTLSASLLESRNEAVVLHAQIAQSEDANSALNQRVLEFDAAVKDLSGRNEALRAELGELKGQHAAMRGALEQAQRSIYEMMALKETVAGLQVRAAEAEKQVTAAHAMLSAARAAADEAASKLVREIDRRRKLEEFIALRLDDSRLPPT